MLDVGAQRDHRIALLLQAAAEWCDPESPLRQRARAALADSEWPPATRERALDLVLRDFAAAVRGATTEAGLTTLAILPGNIIGPVVACAFCAGVAGGQLVLKSAHQEQRLANLVAEQFNRLGGPLKDSIMPMYWHGGDGSVETQLFARVQRIIVFGEDATIASVRQRAPRTTAVIGYGNGFSIGFVSAGADVTQAAESASWDIALFDQRGCMSPQTIYVEGDEGKAVLFAQAVAGALERRSSDLPRAAPQTAERAAVAAAVRRLHLSALPSATHALGTVLLGRERDGIPSFVVAVEPYSGPAINGFGRIVVIKPCLSAAAVAQTLRSCGGGLETVGLALAGDTAASFELTAAVFRDAGARRVCQLGAMQAPPFGYRPRISDFQASSD